jgi:hypothetical protein
MKPFFSLIATFFCFVAFAQDSTAVGGTPVEGLPSWAYVAAAVLLGVYEVLARFIPTISNYSILSVIIKIINAVFPNNKKGGGTFEN